LYISACRCLCLLGWLESKLNASKHFDIFCAYSIVGTVSKVKRQIIQTSIPISSNIFFLFSKTPDCLWGQSSVLFGELWKFSSQRESGWSEAEHSHPSNAKIRNKRSCTSTPPYMHPWHAQGQLYPFSCPSALNVTTAPCVLVSVNTKNSTLHHIVIMCSVLHSSLSAYKVQPHTTNNDYSWTSLP